MALIIIDHVRIQAVHNRDQTLPTISVKSMKRISKNWVSVRFRNLMIARYESKPKLRSLEFHIYVQKVACIFVQTKVAHRLESHFLATQSKIIAKLTKSTKYAKSHLKSNQMAKYLIRKKAKMESQFTLKNVPTQVVLWETSFYQDASTIITIAAL